MSSAPDTGEMFDSPGTQSNLLGNFTDLGIALRTPHVTSSPLARIVMEARRATGADAATLFIREGAYLRFAVVQNDVMIRRLGEEEIKRRFEAQRLPLHLPSLAAYVATTGATLNIPDAYTIPPDQPYGFNWQVDLRTGYRTRSVLAVPLQDPSLQILGVLQLINALDAAGRVVPFHAGLEDVARTFASSATGAIGNAPFEELAFKDPLTEAYSRRYLMLRADEEAKRAARDRQPLSAVLLDLDEFAAVNDGWGRGAGDEVLRECVHLLAHQSRRSTVIARYGGDEFVALLRDTPKAAAITYAERMRGIVERYPFRCGRVTASFGVAAIPEDVATGRDLIQSADDARYQAKRQGGNGVEWRR